MAKAADATGQGSLPPPPQSTSDSRQPGSVPALSLNLRCVSGRPRLVQLESQWAPSPSRPMRSLLSLPPLTYLLLIPTFHLSLSCSQTSHFPFPGAASDPGAPGSSLRETYSDLHSLCYLSTGAQAGLDHGPRKTALTLRLIVSRKKTHVVL